MGRSVIEEFVRSVRDPTGGEASVVGVVVENLYLVCVVTGDGTREE